LRFGYVRTPTHARTHARTHSGIPKSVPSLASSGNSVDRPAVDRPAVDRPAVRYSRPVSRNAERLLWPTPLRSKADLAEEAIQ